MQKTYEKVFSIKQWPVCERPREKLFQQGEHLLSDSELLAILLRTGCRGKSALDLARSVLQQFKSFRNMNHLDARSLHDIKGLGPAKIAQIKAALEIGRRFCEENVRQTKVKIKSSADVYSLFRVRMRDLKKEVFKIVFLSSQNEIINVVEESQGTVNQASPFIREILHKALEHFAAAIICLHNHPSGSPVPSPEDKDFTGKLTKACQVMGLFLLDHIIIGDNAYYSFSDEGQI